jgi:tetraacyldisaccharide 4'-kinase
MNPASAIFAAAVRLRNALYDRGFFKSRKLSRPVASVGNISVGGSGKTPFVIALGTLLKERGIGFDVLSRGYGRRQTETAVVDPGGTAEQFGDEPLLMARKLGVPVVVGASRFEAGLLAEKQFPQSKLHLLDDGFQHRRLHRDFDIVMLPESDLSDRLLPAGRLREPLSSLKRADALVLAPGMASPDPEKLVWRARRSTQIVWLREHTQPAPRVVAFCGIARPKQFFAVLVNSEVNVTDHVTFPDHHHYTRRDVDRLLKMQAQSGAQGFVTTEKDLINLGPLAEKLPLAAEVLLTLELENPQEILDLLLHTLEQHRHS